MATATTTTSRDDHALLPSSGGAWHGAIADLPSFTGRRAQEKEVPSDEEEEEEALDTAATIARIKQPADRLIRSSCIDPKRDPSMIAPRRTTVDELHRRYDSARSQSISRMDFEPIYVFSPSFGDTSMETSIGSEVSDTFSPPPKDRSEGVYQYTGFSDSGLFSDNIFAISKVNDSGTKGTTQSFNEEEALDTAATIARIKHSAIRLIRSSSIDRKRDPSIIAPRSATVDDFQSPKEQRRYDSARTQSKSWVDLKGTYLVSPSFGDESTEISIGSEVIDTSHKVRSEGAYTTSAGSAWFPDNIVAISKVKDSGTENISQSKILRVNRPTSVAYNPSGKRATSEQYRSSLTSTCGTTQTTMPSEEGEQRACLTYISSHPTGRQRCVIVAVIIGLVFLAVPLITLGATGYLRDNDGQSAPAGSPTSNPNTGLGSTEDIFRYRVPHTVGGG